MVKIRKRKIPLSKEQPQKRDKSKKELPKRSNFCSSFCTALMILVALFGAVAGIGYYRAPFTALVLDEIPVTIEFSGSLQINQRLTKGSKFSGFIGPESLVEDENKNVYTGLEDGRIVKIAPSKKGELGRGETTNISTGYFPELIRIMPSRSTGRPLGLRLKKDTLYVADANYGIYSIALSTKKMTSLVAIDTVDPPLRFPNDLYVTKENNFIYFTDVSLKYAYDRSMYITLEGVCDGRVLQYNINTKEVLVVASRLCFPNGIQFSVDEKRMLLSETFGHKVDIFDTSSWDKINFIKLPFFPDNIRPTGKGSYWVTGLVLRDRVNTFLQRTPAARQILAGLLSYETIMRSFGSKTHNMISEITDDGEIVQSLHDQEGQLTHGLSEATTLSDGRLVLGSFIAPFFSILEDKNIALGLRKH